MQKQHKKKMRKTMAAKKGIYNPITQRRTRKPKKPSVDVETSTLSWKSYL